MSSLQNRLDAVINQINTRLHGFEFVIDCNDIGLDPKDKVLVQAIIRSYKQAEWTVRLNSRDKTLIFL